MRVKANHATIREIANNAAEIGRAFTRFQGLIADAVADAPEEVRAKVAAVIFDVNILPIDAIYKLRAVSDFYKEEFERIDKASTAVRKFRLRESHGLPRVKRPYQRKAHLAETYATHEYEEIIAQAQATGNLPNPDAERHVEPKPVRDATPDRGGDLSF